MKKQSESGMRGNTTKSKIHRRFSSLGHGLLVLASVVGAGCAGEDETAVNNRSQDEVDLGVALEGLGTNFTSCTAADTTSPTGFVTSSKQLTLTLSANTDAVISVVNGKIKVNGWQCATAAVSGPPAVASVELTTTNVAKIVVAGLPTNKVVLDLLPGSFGNIFTGTGGIVIQGGGSVGVRGTGLANNFKVGQEGSSATGPFYFELSGDSRADVRVEGNPTAMSFALGDGNDTFSAEGQALTTTALGGSAVTGDLVTEAISVFGGLGNDTIKGGLGNDTLNGGEGNDWFTTSAGSTADGADLYIGGTGTDTVDYSGRTVAISASIAPTYDSGWVEGVDITNATVAAAATMTVNVNGAGATTVTFASQAIGTTAILAAINGTASLGATAFVNDRGEIAIKATATGVSLTVAGTVATQLFTGLKTNNGVSALGLDPDDGNSGEGDDIQADVENLIGGSGNDYLSGSIGSNTISGGAGNDDISGGPAGSTCANDVDVLNGGDGNDIFRLGTLTNCGDAVDGGNGTDVASYELRTVGVSVTIDTTANDGEDQEADKILSTVEVILGSNQADTLIGGAGNDEIHGGAGADFISGLAGNDTLVGGPGVDTLLGGAGEDYFNEKDVADAAFVQVILPTVSGSESDLINGGADFDTVDYGRTSTTALSATLCVATTNTDMGHCLDSLGAAVDNDDPDTDDLTNVEHFIGGAGADTIVGSTGSDFIEGGGGNDVIDGGSGTDTLFGDAGNDSLVGGSGDDTLDGALGTNTLVGGGGDDICTVGAAGVVDPTCEI